MSRWRPLIVVVLCLALTGVTAPAHGAAALPVTITVEPTVAVAGEPTTLTATVDVATLDEIGPPERYVWTVGEDRSPIETDEPTLVYRFPEPGSYLVGVTAHWDSYRHAESTRTVVEVIERPRAVCRVSARTVATGEPVTLDASGSTGGTVVFDTEGIGEFEKETDETLRVTVRYERPGVVRPAVRVIWTEPTVLRLPTVYSDTATCGEITVERPVARFTVDRPVAQVGVPVAFDATASAGDPDRYVWTFGDGRTVESTDPVVTHPYLAPGEYAVRLEVVTGGGVVRALKTVTVTPIPPIARCRIEGDGVAIGDPVTLDASRSVGGERFAFRPSAAAVALAPSERDRAVVRYDRAGTYTATVVVSNAGGTDSAVCGTVVVQPATGDGDGRQPDGGTTPDRPAGSWGITVSPRPSLFGPNVDEPVTFEVGPGATAPDGYEYEWRIDGEGPLPGATLVHRFDTPGEHTVTLRVTDPTGAVTTVERTVRVEERVPGVVVLSFGAILFGGVALFGRYERARAEVRIDCPLAVRAIGTDADGREYVVVANVGGVPLPLVDYRLDDGERDPLALPDVGLDADEERRLYTGPDDRLLLAPPATPVPPRWTTGTVRVRDAMTGQVLLVTRVAA